jgi:hypothetical protein
MRVLRTSSMARDEVEADVFYNFSYNPPSNGGAAQDYRPL